MLYYKYTALGDLYKNFTVKKKRKHVKKEIREMAMLKKLPKAKQITRIFISSFARLKWIGYVREYIDVWNFVFCKHLVSFLTALASPHPWRRITFLSPRLLNAHVEIQVIIMLIASFRKVTHSISCAFYLLETKV